MECTFYGRSPRQAWRGLLLPTQ
ncbi:DUF3649 domain-containing protein [Pseudomonadota bacterium AL_CKDN230030165-1A_HGKHYDSX7]